MLQKIANWGNYPVIDAEVHRFDGPESLRQHLDKTEGGMIARGLGRCYGDSSLAQNIVNMLYYNHIFFFDREKGVIHCQAGVSLEDILQTVVPYGWFLPVTPGTKFITVGGAIAANVHGKNHHKEGCFCGHVIELNLMLPDGSEVKCSRIENRDIFDATCGGMGLTGVILNATFQLKPITTAYIREETILAKDLDHIMHLFNQSEDWTYSVAWIDCLAGGRHMGRSVMMRGEHATVDELELPDRRDPLHLQPRIKLNVPFSFPSFALNTLSVKAFNFTIYNSYANHTFITDYDRFFYPLDSIHNWNRIYGRRGFTQYQFVLPRSVSHRGLIRILERISKSGMGSFLAILKLFGKQNDLISFPRAGYTLALDFPLRKAMFPLLDELDRIVLDFGGRIYMAKDVRMKKETFLKGYPNAAKFNDTIKELNGDGLFRSLQSDRLGITA